MKPEIRNLPKVPPKVEVPNKPKLTDRSAGAFTGPDGKILDVTDEYETEE